MNVRPALVLSLVAAVGVAALLVRRGGEEVRRETSTALRPSPPDPRRAPSMPALRRPSPRRTEIEDPSKDAPWVWDERPMIEQVRGMLRAIDLDRETIRAWRSRPQEVAAAIVVLLKDAAVDRNQREMGLGILEDLGLEWTRPHVLEVARSDPDEGIRAGAIRTLGALGADEALIRGRFAAARSDEERIQAVETLGELGQAASLPLLEEAARIGSNTTLLHVAEQAATKVRVLNSPTRDVELVQILHRETYPMRDWALERIVAMKDPATAHHLRAVLDAQRRLPKNEGMDYFIYDLVAGLRTLGQPLSPAETEFLERYERGDRPSLPW